MRTERGVGVGHRPVAGRGREFAELGFLVERGRPRGADAAREVDADAVAEAFV